MRTALVRHNPRAAHDTRNAATHATWRISVWGVVGAIFLLAAVVGLHGLAHLHGQSDARRCAVCQWSTDTSVGVVAGIVALLPTLTLLALFLSPKTAHPLAPIRRTRPPRAPPALGEFAP
jgi:hypothetical protein